MSIDIPTTTHPRRIEGKFDVLGGISTLLAGYSGGITIVRELAQNTDDVPGDDERWLEFHFQADRLIIKNSTHFRPKDFDNITTIARGGKRDEQRRTIGAFGVGFVSVYQLTDTPIIRSSGRELHLKPGLHEFPIDDYDSSLTSHTEFELPYRRQRTVVSERLGMPPVTDQWLHDILRDLPMETYRLLFFLRRLSRIAVFQNEQLLSEVSRTIVGDPAEFERITLTLKQANEVQQTHTWLRFTGAVPGNAPEKPDGKPAKDRAVHVVVPDGDVPDAFLSKLGSGRLYNYLPTEIETGLPFQINGDFYPSTDRKNIDNDHPNSRAWNERVLAAIGQCLARALPKLLDHFTNAPLQFYRRIDVSRASEPVAPVVSALINAARPLQIFFTNSGWRERIDTRWIKLELREIAEQMSSALMSREQQEAAWHLIQQLDVSEITFSHLLKTIRDEVKFGTPLNEGPSYLRTIAQIEALYRALDSGVAQGQDEMVKQTPIFLDHNGRLWPASLCIRTSNEELRKDLAESGLHFWNFNLERYRFASSLVAPFALNHLWSTLREQIPAEVALTDGPEWLNTPTKLYRLYRTIDRTREPVLKSAVVNLAICLNRDQKLCRPERLLLPDGDRVLYELLADDRIAPLVAQQIYDEKLFRTLYTELGVPTFTSEHLFERLNKLAREELPIERADPCLNTREKLLKLYRFLQIKRGELERKQEEDLRHRLPLWLCRDGFLRLAKNCSLPPESTDLPEYIKLGEVLDVKHSDNLRGFLTEVVGLKPLPLDQIIKQSFIPQYVALEREQQLDALRFLRRCTETIRDNPELRDTLRQTNLIRGDDDQLHRPAAVCYRDASCLALFGPRFNRLHAFYAEPNTGNADNWQWRDLFRLLGVTFHAPKDVVLEEIRQITTRPPRQGREQIEKIFRYIEEHWESFYQQSSISSRLKNERWLPADGDEQHWHRPNEMYQRQEKPLVSHVAPVLGFTEARRPKQSIAEALGFPISVPVEKIVQQLLKLSAHGEPATHGLYNRLNSDAVTDEQLKPLQKQAVIYADNRYWKANQIFLSDQRTQFGRYRGYISSNDYRRLFERLNAKTTPIPKDYADLLCEISAKQRDNLHHDDVALIKNAYEQLSGVDELILNGLRPLPCVLVSVQQEPAAKEIFALCMADSAVLQPPERLHSLFPLLPVARYTPVGETTLRRMGVRPIEQVLHYEYRLTLQFTEPITLALFFSQLRPAIRRLLFHYGRSIERELPDIIDRLSRLEGYWQPAIDLSYTVTLGTQEYTSNGRSEDSFYDQKREHVHLRKGLNKDDQCEELAVVLGEVLALREGTQALFTALIRNPDSVMKKLDKNNIKSLPPEFDLVIEAEAIEDLTVGTPDELVDETPIIPATPTAPSHLADTGYEKPAQIPLGRLFAEPAATGSGTLGRTPSVRPTPQNTQRTPPSKSAHNGAPVTGAPPKGESSIAHGGKDRVVSSPTPTAPPRDPAAPPFQGATTMSSPSIPTDYDGLRERARQFAVERGLPTTLDAAAPVLPQAPRKQRQARPAEEHDHVRFVLSFREAESGFLLLNERAKSLFPSRPGQVMCRTDDGSSFPLWFEWQRERPIAYNQQALRDFFADNGIPAGGMVYLQREHGASFRLYYNRHKHTVREVRIAFNEQGEVRYEIHDVQIECETSEVIYRAERRFEDQTALWLEAVGKKSVEESLCDLLMQAPDFWLAEDELKDMLAVERMVAASTVKRTLTGKPYFESDEQGNWRLDPAKLLMFSRDDTVTRWHKATTKLLDCDDTTLTEASATLRPPLNNLSGRLLRLEAAATPIASSNEDMASLIQQLNADPQNDMISSDLRKCMHRRVTASDTELALDVPLRAVFSAASNEVWQWILRPTLRPMIEQLQHNHAYTRAYELAQSWSDHDSEHGLDLALLAAESEAWTLVGAGTPTLTDVRRAIEIAPTLTVAREKLHLATQAALRQHEPEHYLNLDTAEHPVDAFAAHINTITDVRPQLNRTDQSAFDRTIMEEARHLWEYLDQQARVRLLLKITRMIDMKAISLKEAEVQVVLDAAERAGGTLAGLLLGHAAWRLCPVGLPLQKRIADHLMGCHNDLEIWEKANNQPWKQLARIQFIKQQQQGCATHASSHANRERKIIELLRQPDEATHGSTLAAERADLLSRYERDYQKLLNSAA